MKKLVFLIISLCSLLSFISCKNKVEEAPLLTNPDEINAHKKIFTSLMDTVYYAFKHSDASLLYNHLDQESIAYYNRLLQNTKTKKIQGSYMEKSDCIVALMFLYDAELQRIDVKQFLQVIVDYYKQPESDSKPKKENKSIDLEDLEVRGSLATANTSTLSPLKFINENNQWKYNILLRLERMSEITVDLKKVNNTNEKQTIFNIITTGHYENNPNIKRSFDEVWLLINK
ncbi:hypothetical protein [Myroides odoratus]|uniref:hypothetical protein n=1 Tax=Myroides odoratus TaxID=256 RepID=UPI0007659E67|nr:hypothetical protein [Myroides odoratus]